MKTIRIILLILIIIGFGALFTQKNWVPKLVNQILLLENTPIAIIDNSAVVLPKTQPNITLVDGRQCYTYNQEATNEAPYKVDEFIDITISGKSVTGTKRGTQSGPDMINGYIGSIIGTLSQNKITAIYSYMVEGSKNKEKEIYQANKTGIEKLRYPLIEEGGILIPDISKEFKTLLYSRVGCETSN